MLHSKESRVDKPVGISRYKGQGRCDLKEEMSQGLPSVSRSPYSMPFKLFSCLYCFSNLVKRSKPLSLQLQGPKESSLRKPLLFINTGQPFELELSALALARTFSSLTWQPAGSRQERSFRTASLHAVNSRQQPEDGPPDPPSWVPVSPQTPPHCPTHLPGYCTLQMLE